MKISKKGEYALRAMINLSRKNKEGYIKINTIAEEENIPRKFLEQILLQLKNSGLIHSKRGSSGGYKLIRNPEDISLANIIRIIDGPLAPVRCVSETGYVSSPEFENSALYEIMKKVRDKVAEILENTSLSDLIDK